MTENEQLPVLNFSRFTDRARKVMQLANQEAQRFGHEYLGTEHIVIGLAKEGSGVASNVLKNLEIDLAKIRSEVEKIVVAGPETRPMGKLPISPRAKNVLQHAMHEASNLNHNYVGTEHILLGLLQERDCVAVQIMLNLGCSSETVRDEVLRLIGSPKADEKDSGWAVNVILHAMKAAVESAVAERLAVLENRVASLEAKACHG